MINPKRIKASGDKFENLSPLIRNNNLKVLPRIEDTIGESNLDVFLYLRVSTTKEDQATSLPYQEKFLREWCKLRGYNVIGVFKDKKTGAYIDGRDEFQFMLQEINDRKAKGVIVKEVSRASRDLEELLGIKRKISDSGAFLICVNIDYDSRLHRDNFILSIHGALAEKEKNITSDRVKATQMVKARDGKTNVPSPAFGYKLSEDKQNLVIDTEKAKIYLFIVDKFLEGWGRLKICQYLNSNGIKPKRGKKWCTNTIMTILTNPVYRGKTIFNATTLKKDENGKARRYKRPEEEVIIKENTHESLISKEKFEKIQNLIEEKREKDTKEWSCSKKYLLSGRLYCDFCGEKIYGSRQPSKKNNRTNKDGGKEYYYYYVDQNRSGKCEEKSIYWDMARVDNIVIDEIKKFFGNRKLVEERIRAKQYLYNKNLKNDKQEREKLYYELEVEKIALGRVRDAYEEGIYGLDELRERKSKHDQKIKTIQKKLTEIDYRLQMVDTLEERYIEIRDKIMKIIDNIENLDYEMKDMLLQKIVKSIFIKKDYSLRIEYTFED